MRITSNDPIHPRLPEPRATAAASAEAPAGARAAKKPDDPRLGRACEEFESVLVRQLLASSEKGAAERSGYGSMVTDALAGAVSDGGGLGVAEALREALSRSR